MATYRVVREQPSSRMWLVCGAKNRLGLKCRFYELENNELVAIYKPVEEHQGYPGRLHGGIIAALLDETIGRAVMIGSGEGLWGVTIEFTMRLKKPVPLNQTLRVISRITRDTRRIFEGTGEILLEDGSVAVEGSGKYLKLRLSKIADFDEAEQEWGVVKETLDPERIEINRQG